MATKMGIEEYIQSLSEVEQSFYFKLKSLIESVYPDINIVLFAKQPYFYLEKHASINFHRRPSIMMAFFKDHVNIFSTANESFEKMLPMYKFTEKHTLQLYFNQVLQVNELKDLFYESLIHHDDSKSE